MSVNTPESNQPLEMQLKQADTETRLQMIAALSIADGKPALPLESQQALAALAVADAEPRVRAAAAARVDDRELLQQICAQAREKDKAVYKHCRERLDEADARQAKRNAAEQQAVELCQSMEALAGKTPGPLTAAQQEHLLKQWRNLHNGPTTPVNEGLEQRFNEATLLASEKLAVYQHEHREQQQQQQAQEQLAEFHQQTNALLDSFAAPVSEEQRQALEQHQQQLQQLLRESKLAEPAELLRDCHDLEKALRQFQKAWQQIEQQGAELENLEAALSHTSDKDSQALLELHGKWHSLHDGVQWPAGFAASARYQQSEQLGEKLDKLLHSNENWQQKLIGETEKNLGRLEVAIEEGRLREAQSLWDRTHNAINRITDPIQHSLREKAAPLKARVSELLAWKNFAATEKKKELIDKMQQLEQAALPPPQKAKKIHALQEEWKKLGHSDDNDKLWKQFSDTARVAFEPCKTYFAERKEKMRFNLAERTKICEQLEEYAQTLQSDSAEINISQLNKLETKAQQEWKRYAPVAQNKIKNIQKRFNAVLGSLRHHKRSALQHNAAQKHELIEKARQLLDNENIQQATQAAKQLQNEWKKIGPSPYKEERKLWNSFREACDKLFARRDESFQQAREQGRKQLAAIKATLKKLASLLDLPDDEFTQSRKQFNELKAQFTEQLTAEVQAERRTLTEQFNRLTSKYDKRRRAAPDKKSLQLTSALKAQADFCQQWEEALLQNQPVTLETDELQQRWDELPKPDDKELAQVINRRFKSLLQHSDDHGQLQKLATDNEMRARELCVEMEIQADMDSPAADKALRMQLQLNHLKQGFGKNSNIGKSKAQIINDLEMQFLCIGPLLPSSRKSLEMRITGIRQKAQKS